MTGRGRKRVGRPIIDVAICLQIMYGITYEELDEWVEHKTVRQQRRMGNGK